jgi:hypothetical protein
MEIEQRKVIIEQEAAYQSDLFSQNLAMVNQKLGKASTVGLVVIAGVLAFVLVKNLFKKKKTQLLTSADLSGATAVTISSQPQSAWYSMVRDQMLMFVLNILRNQLAKFVDEQSTNGNLDKIYAYIKDNFYNKFVASANKLDE